jgi:peptidyl-prolyl cis-trans isomerase B (cyclophilin B)
MSDYQPIPPTSTPYTGTTDPTQRTNVLAIIALILGIVVPPGGIICGHIALSQIKKTRENGRGLALAGTIIGYVLTILYILFIVGIFVFYAIVIGSVASSGGFSTSP